MASVRVTPREQARHGSQFDASGAGTLSLSPPELFGPLFPLAFAAFCIWLAVRLINRRERRLIQFLMIFVGLAAVLGMPLLAFIHFFNVLYGP